MKIKFTGHVESQREVEISQEDLKKLFKAILQEFIFHVTYSSAYKKTSGFTSPVEETVANICKKHNVDFCYEKDRVSFMKEIVNSIENPYQ